MVNDTTDLLKQIDAEAGEEYTFEYLHHQLPSISVSQLSLALDELERQGKVKRILRVESPKGGGVEDFEDFDSVDELPDQIADWRSDKTLTVTPENVRVIYRVLESE